MRYLPISALIIVIIVDHSLWPYSVAGAVSPMETRSVTKKKQVEVAEEARFEELIDILFETTPMDPQSLNPFEVGDMIKEALDLSRNIKACSSRAVEKLAILRQLGDLRPEINCNLNRLLARYNMESQYVQYQRLHVYLELINQNLYEDSMKWLQTDLRLISRSIKLQDIHTLRQFVIQQMEPDKLATLSKEIPFETLARSLLRFSEEIDGKDWKLPEGVDLSRLLATISPYASEKFNYPCTIYQQMMGEYLDKYNWLVSHMSFYMIDLEPEPLELLECTRICQEFQKISKLKNLLASTGIFEAESSGSKALD